MNEKQQISDAELLKRIAQEDPESFRVLVERYSRLCYRVAYRVLKEQVMAEDVVQEVMLKIWSRPGLWDENRGAKFSTWLYKIVMNAALDVYRKRRREVHYDDWEGFEEPGDSPSKEADLSNVAKQLRVAVAKLPFKQRMSISLCRLEGMSHKEAAAVIGISAKAVERAIERGLRALRQNFSNQQIDITELLSQD